MDQEHGQAPGNPDQTLAFQHGDAAERGRSVKGHTASRVHRLQVMETEDHTAVLDLHMKNILQFMPLQYEESLLRLLWLLPVGCILLDADFHFKYWNPAAEQIFGYNLTEIIGKHPSELIIPYKKSHQFDQTLQKIRRGDTQARDIESVAKDGSLHTCKWHFTLLRDGSAGQSSLLAIVQDVTGEKNANEKNRRQIERIHALRAIDTAISGSLDFQVTLNIVLQQTLSQLKMDAAVVLVYDPPMGILRFAAGRGLRTEVLQLTSLRIGEGYAGQAAMQKQVIKVPDLQHHQKDFLHSPRFYKEGFKSYYCVPLIAKGEVKGVLESFHRTPFSPDAEWLDFFETIGGQAAIAIDNAMLFNDLQQSNLELTLAYDTTLEGWSKALDLRDKDTEGHTRRVTEMTERLASAINVKQADRIHMRRGAVLHDIGKMGIPDSILLKEGSLSENEWEIMRQHPTLALDMLSTISYLRPALEIPYCHHEKWNGTGYPRGLRKEQIPLAARIFAVADVFDALTSDRPYRRAWSTQQALEHIRSEAGNHFDPEVVDVFMRVIEKLG